MQWATSKVLGQDVCALFLTLAETLIRDLGQVRHSQLFSAVDILSYGCVYFWNLEAAQWRIQTCD